MTSLLVKEPPLQTLPSLAAKVGLNEAIVLNQIHYWLNPKRNQNIFEGKRWVHNTYEQWQQQFPFWSVPTLRRIFGALEAQDILHSFSRRDDPQKGKYYTINYKRLKEKFPSIDFFQNQEDSSPVINLSIPIDQNDHLQQICGVQEGDQTEKGGLINLSTAPDQNDHLQEICALEESDQSDKFPLINLSILPDHNDQDKENRGFKGCGQNEQDDQPEQGQVIKLITTYKLNTENTDREEKEEEEKKEKNKKKEQLEKFFSEKEDEATLSSAKFQEMVDVWNAHIQIPLYGKEALIRLTASRVAKLAILVKEAFYGESSAWDAYCQKIAANRYLRGENARGTRVTFDWAIQVTNAAKILEGAIYDKQTAKKPSSLSSCRDPWSKSDDLFNIYANGILIERDPGHYNQLLHQHCANNGYPNAWVQVCKYLVSEVGQAVFKNWFKDMVPVNLDSSKIRLVVKGSFYRDHIYATYALPFRKALKAALPHMNAFEIEVGGHDPPTPSTCFAGVNVSPPAEAEMCP